MSRFRRLVVDIEDYKTLKPFAYTPDQLCAELKKHMDMLPEDAEQDLKSGNFLFCRGGRSAAHLAVFEGQQRPL